MTLHVRVPAELVGGGADEGYGAVADAFRRNFTDRGEVGAACVVVRDGRTVVDLWGGYRDGRTQQPWEEGTFVTVFSTTKGMAAATVAIAHARGWIDWDEAVAAHWPEFAVAGKERVTIRQLLSHQAGVPVLDASIELPTIGDPDALGAILAAQRPAWRAGTRHGYHSVTFGWYASELLRRVDPHHRTLGRFFADEVAQPLGIAFHIGLPTEIPQERLATIHAFRRAETLLHVRELPARFVLRMAIPTTTTARSFQYPRIPGGLDAYNERSMLAVEIPAANGTGEPRAIARVYGELATGGQALGLRPETLRGLVEPAPAPTRGLRDAILHVDRRYSCGYTKPSPSFRFGGSTGLAFGTPGAGGSFGFADPEFGIGFAYAMNRSGFRLCDDRREVALRDALYRSIGGPPQSPDSRPRLTRVRPSSRTRPGQFGTSLIGASRPEPAN
jgi:CubicO group peptidase (beta-lactamase class C family)